MKPIKEITEGIFKEYVEILNTKFAEYARSDNLQIRKMIQEEIYKYIFEIIEYMFKHYNYKHLDKTDYYDSYEEMVERAFRNYNPEKSVFWNYFINGLCYKKNEQDRKNNDPKLVPLVNAEESAENYQAHTVSEDKVDIKESAEETYLYLLDKEEQQARLKAAGYNDFGDLLLSVYSRVANEIIEIKKGLFNDKRKNKNTGIMFHAFFTSENVGFIRNGAYYHQKGKNNKKQEYLIESGEVIEIMNRTPEEYYARFDDILLDYTFRLKPLTINEISENKLKTQKEILGENCKEPDKEIKVPFVHADVLAAYFKEIYGMEQSTQNISSANIKYQKLLGKYAFSEHDENGQE